MYQNKEKSCVIFHDKMIQILGFFSPERNLRGVLGQRRVGGARDIKDKTFVPHNIRQIMQRLGREAGQCGLSAAREIKVFSRLIGQIQGFYSVQFPNDKLTQILHIGHP